MATVRLDITQLAAYIQAATILVTFGRVTVEQIRAMFATRQLTEEQLNAICDAVKSDAERRKELADAESGIVDPT
jgi:hypothetical protein